MTYVWHLEVSMRPSKESTRLNLVTYVQKFWKNGIWKRILTEIARSVEYEPNGTQKKVYEELDITDEELSNAFRNLKKDNPCTRKQEFQFRLLSSVVYTNTS